MRKRRKQERKIAWERDGATGGYYCSSLGRRQGKIRTCSALHILRGVKNNLPLPRPTLIELIRIIEYTPCTIILITSFQNLKSKLVLERQIHMTQIIYVYFLIWRLAQI